MWKKPAAKLPGERRPRELKAIATDESVTSEFSYPFVHGKAKSDTTTFVKCCSCGSIESPENGKDGCYCKGTRFEPFEGSPEKPSRDCR